MLTRTDTSSKLVDVARTCLLAGVSPGIEDVSRAPAYLYACAGVSFFFDGVRISLFLTEVNTQKRRQNHA